MILVRRSYRCVKAPEGDPMEQNTHPNCALNKKKLCASQPNAWPERRAGTAHRHVIDKSPYWVLCHPWEHGNLSEAQKREDFLKFLSSTVPIGCHTFTTQTKKK